LGQLFTLREIEKILESKCVKKLKAGNYLIRQGEAP
jgi:hypothetical protein